MALRYYQQEAINATCNFLESGRQGNPLLAMPTGIGKSHVIAGFIQQLMRWYPRLRFIMATHVKELIEQNHEKLLSHWPTAPVGIHSAGLKQRDLVQPIIYGGIASMIGKAADLGHRDIIIVDEAHLIAPDENTMYQRFFKILKAINPYIRIVGLTATQFRLGQGLLTNDGLFTDIVYDITGVEAFNRLIDEGYLMPLIPKRTEAKLDISAVGISKGELKQDQLQAAVDKYEVTLAALQEAIFHGQNRRSWMTFASGIEHAEHIAEMLRSFGISSAAVHSKLSTDENDKRIKAYKAGQMRCIVNYKKLTTGFDDPKTDFIIDLYPTISPGLHVQKYGRGTRPDYAPGFDLETLDGRLSAIQASHKQNTLVMDFGGNTARLGTINDPRIPKKKGPGGGDAPIRICVANTLKANEGKPPSTWVQGCDTYNHASTRFCKGCNQEFSFAVKFSAEAATDEIVKKTEAPIVEYYDVLKVEHLLHIKEGSTPQIRVVYHSLVKKFSEFYNFESPVGLVKHKAHEWFRQCYPLKEGEEIPKTTAEVLAIVSQLRTPKKIRVWANRKPYAQVLGHEY